MLTTESETLETIGGLLNSLPEHRRIDAAKLALEALTPHDYEALLLELNWVDVLTIENMREDIDYWQDRAKQAEDKLEKIAEIADTV